MSIFLLWIMPGARVLTLQGVYLISYCQWSPGDTARIVMSQTDQWVNHPETLCNISKQNTPYCNYRVIKIIMGSLVLSPQYTNMLK